MVRFSSTAGNNWFLPVSINSSFLVFFGLDSGCDSEILIYPILKKTNQHLPYVPPGTGESMIFQLFPWILSEAAGKLAKDLGKWDVSWCLKMAVSPMASWGCFGGLCWIWSRRFLLLNFGGLGGSVFPEFVYLKEYVTIATYTINFGGSWEKDNFHGIHFF